MYAWTPRAGAVRYAPGRLARVAIAPRWTGGVLTNDRRSSPTEDVANQPAQAIFQQQWHIYRVLVDENYLFHREAYACLHRFLVEEAAGPFRFLDIACGDATASVAALSDTPVAHYRGIDASPAALALAREAVRALPCPASLELGDFVDVLRERPQPADVAWIGLSLHHLRTPDKLEVMRAVRGIVGEEGAFLIYEDAGPDGEPRQRWLERWDAQQPAWTAYAPHEWEAITSHVHAADFPETASGWRQLGHDAGFSRVRELFVAPSDLLRLYCFQA